jgi:hypothetical protein
MADDVNDGPLEESATELARSIWQVVLLSRDEYKARGLAGKAARRRLVDKILKYARAVRRERAGGR